MKGSDTVAEDTHPSIDFAVSSFFGVYSISHHVSCQISGLSEHELKMRHIRGPHGVLAKDIPCQSTWNPMPCVPAGPLGKLGEGGACLAE